MLAKPIVDALQKISRVTGTAQIGMRLQNRKLRLVGENESRSMAILLDADTDGDWAVSVPKSILDQSLKSRKEIDIKVVNNRLIFSAGRFDAEFATEPYSQGPELQRDSARRIGRDIQARLLHALEIASLSPIFETDTTFCVQMDNKASYSACFDNLHFALVEDEPVKGSLDFAFPTRSFKTIVDAALHQEYTWSTTNSSICAWNSEWELFMPYVQSESGRQIADVRALAETFGDSWVRCGARELYDAVVTATASVEEGGNLRISVKNRELTVTGSSSIGKVAQRMECKQLIRQWTDLWIDPKTLLSLLIKAPGDYIEIGAHDDKFIFIRAEDESSKATYASLLGNDPSVRKS